jgi:hypothetical protein
LKTSEEYRRSLPCYLYTEPHSVPAHCINPSVEALSSGAVATIRLPHGTMPGLHWR